MPHAGRVASVPTHCVVYRPKSPCVYVLAVAHQRRELGYWLNRLKGLTAPKAPPNTALQWTERPRLYCN